MRITSLPTSGNTGIVPPWLQQPITIQPYPLPTTPKKGR